MNTAEKLLEAAKEIWKAYEVHPFVSGIQNGTLDKEKFRYYIIQDYLYLKEYVKMFALGVAKAKSVEMADLFAKYITAISSELNIHNGYLAQMQITQEEIASTATAIDNVSYTSYMLRIAYEEGEAEILAAVLSCAYSYECIAKHMVKEHPDSVKHVFYGEWIRGYSSEAYAEENVLLMDALNCLTEQYTEQQIQHLIDIFVLCSRYELAFWEMAWNMSR